MSSYRLPVQSHAFALLIDADNTSVDLFPQIMKKVEEWGKITMRRVYGNQETLLSQKWKDLCLQYALHRDPALAELLTQAVGKIMLEKKLEWVSLPRLGSCLKQLNPQFQAKTYGHKSLPELIKTCTDLFEIRPQGNHLEVRLKARNTG